MKCDFHIHSMYSYDSMMNSRDILKQCKKKGYSTVSITDHNSIKGSLEAKKYEKEFGVSVLIGEEILTDSGDIIGLNLNEELKSRTWSEAIDEIRSQGGISILPHPFRGHKNVENIAKYVDLIEVWNSHTKPICNEMALHLAKASGKPPLAGSDAHVPSEIGNVIMEFEDVFDFEKKFDLKYCKKWEKAASYVIKDIKINKYHKIPLHLMRAIY
jgi:predicted metal-dependent phosphoesterase TrpH